MRTASRRELWQTLRKQWLPWLIFMTTASLALYLWFDVGQRSPIIGFVQRTEHLVAPTHPGKIQRIVTQLGQQVSTGQVLALLDPSEIEAEIRVQEAELERLKMSGIREQLRALSATGRFAEVQEETSTALAKTQAEHRFKTAELETLSKKRAEMAELLAKGMVVKRDVINMEVQQAALENEVRAAESTIKLLQQQWKLSQARQQALPEKVVELSQAPLKAQMTVIERRLEWLALQRDSLTLRAPCDGRVSMVHQREGGVAKPGDPVVTVVADAADRVVACVYENMADVPRIGMEVTLSARLGSSKSLHGHVVSLGPGVGELPVRCRPQPTQKAWGRDMVVLLDKPGNVLPGEGFTIRLREGSSFTREASAAPQANRDRGPEPMAVPEALSAASRFEPSGLIWVPRLGRYLIVSDDTGWPGRDEHAPWLFTMDAQGRVDDQPLRVKGVSKFNDLESIAPGPGGVLYVLSSQSFSKNGNRNASRQAFLRLVPDGQSYRVSGSVSLAALLDVSDKSLLSSLGLDGSAELNIEGMTAFKEGLLIGLKAPVHADGSALIWQLRAPERLFATGKLADAGVGLWGRLKLLVEADGKTVPGGIAELLQLPDGSLLVSATASGIKPKRQSGSVWHVRKPAAPDGVLSASPLQTFAGLKPEGLALSPRPGHVMVVFDNDQATPSWLELPWPR